MWRFRTTILFLGMFQYSEFLCISLLCFLCLFQGDMFLFYQKSMIILTAIEETRF